MLGVFHRQFVQAELLPHFFKLFRGGVFQLDPDKGVGPGDVVADFAHRDVAANRGPQILAAARDPDKPQTIFKSLSDGFSGG